MTDYWVSKLFFDLQHDPKLAAEYRADMAAVIDRYEIKPDMRKALLADDVATIAPLVNRLSAAILLPDPRHAGSASSSRACTRSSNRKRAPMADLVGVFAASHGPIIARDWETMPRGHRDRLAAGFDEIGRRLKACRPDLLVVVSPDHWVNFFISNLPAVCIGIGDEHDGPPEPFMQKVFPARAAQGPHRLRTPSAADRAGQRFRAGAVAPPQARPRHLHPALAHRRRYPRCPSCL